jgi:chorismate mutase
MIDELRGRIDVIDEQLVALLNTRAACAIEIGRLKRERGMRMYQPDRETAVVRHVRAITTNLGGPLTEEAIGRLFERIIDEARQLEVAGATARDGENAGPAPARSSDK